MRLGALVRHLARAVTAVADLVIQSQRDENTKTLQVEEPFMLLTVVVLYLLGHVNLDKYVV